MIKPKIIVGNFPRRSAIECLTDPLPMPEWKPLTAALDSERCDSCSGTIINGHIVSSNSRGRWHYTIRQCDLKGESVPWGYSKMVLLNRPKFYNGLYGYGSSVDVAKIIGEIARRTCNNSASNRSPNGL